MEQKGSHFLPLLEFFFSSFFAFSLSAAACNACGNFRPRKRREREKERIYRKVGKWRAKRKRKKGGDLDCEICVCLLLYRIYIHSSF